MSSRLTRKDIKRDEVLETIGGFVGFVTKHGKSIVLAAVGLIVLILALVGYRVYAMGRAEEGSRALGRAQRVYEAPIDSEAPEPDAAVAPSFADEAGRTARARELFESVASEFGGTDAGDIASAYLGSIAAAAGDLEGARERWSGFVDRQPDHLLSQEIRVNLMALDRRLGRGEDLVDELRAELASASSKLPEELLLNQLGLTLEELGRADEALDIYQRLVQDFPQSPYSRVASDRISELEGSAAA